MPVVGAMPLGKRLLEHTSCSWWLLVGIFLSMEIRRWIHRWMKEAFQSSLLIISFVLRILQLSIFASQLTVVMKGEGVWDLWLLVLSLCKEENGL
jgi:hypothetical protein